MVNDYLLNEWMDCQANFHLTEISALQQGVLGLGSFDISLVEQLQEDHLKLQGSGRGVDKHRCKHDEDSYFSRWHLVVF